jgi:DnaD/phage-associated family protein
MKQFTGFLPRIQYTPIPNPFLSQVMPRLTKINELKVILGLIALLYAKKGFPKFVSYTELSNDSLLRSNIKQNRNFESELKKCLDSAVKNRVFIEIIVTDNDKSQSIYLLNAESERQAVEKIKSGEIKLMGISFEAEVAYPLSNQSDIFSLYEDNIGLLTPLIAEELKEAERLYPESWIEAAIKEAVTLNKHNWRYIARILENWANEGRIHGATGRYIKEDPNKYIKGKYGHIVKR